MTNRELIMVALMDRARILRKAASSRSHSGPARADLRAQLRTEARRCEEIRNFLAAGPDVSLPLDADQA